MWILLSWLVESFILGMILCVFYKGCIGGDELGLCFFYFKLFNKLSEHVILFYL
ncbi:unnamed protein product [Brassica oleracea var. botrytis]